HAKATIGADGWGLLASAESAGVLAMTLLLTRRRMERPLLSGLLGIAFFGAPMLAFGLTSSLLVLVPVAVVSGAGLSVFSLGWALAMQENIPGDMLSRATSYDALGSFVAIPVGQLCAGGLAAAFGITRVIGAGGAVYVALPVLLLGIGSVRR